MRRWNLSAKTPCFIGWFDLVSHVTQLVIRPLWSTVLFKILKIPPLSLLWRMSWNGTLTSGYVIYAWGTMGNYWPISFVNYPTPLLSWVITNAHQEKRSWFENQRSTKSATYWSLKSQFILQRYFTAWHLQYVSWAINLLIAQKLLKRNMIRLYHFERRESLYWWKVS